MNAECTPAVTPSVYSATTLGCSGSSSVAITIPFFRSDAPSRVNTMTLPAWSVMRSLMSRVLACTESTIRGLAESLTSRV